MLPRFEPCLHWKHQEVLVELQGSWCNKEDFSRLSSTVFHISQHVANCITKLSQQAYFFSKYVLLLLSSKKLKQDSIQLYRVD